MSIENHCRHNKQAPEGRHVQKNFYGCLRCSVETITRELLIKIVQTLVYLERDGYMKRGRLFHVLVILMSGLSLNFPMTAIAQQRTTVVDAKNAAEYDAEDDVNTAVWLTAGGILGIAGNLPLGAVAIGGAYIYQPVPPAERLLGKSAEYVTVYTDTYKAKTRNLRLIAAVQGALGGATVFCMLGVLKVRPWADFVFW